MNLDASLRGTVAPVLAALGVVVGAGACGSSGSPSATPRGGAVESDAGDGVATGEAGTGPVADDAGAIPADAASDAAEAGPAPPDVLPGAPIAAPDGVWTSVPFPEGYCRDGSQAHLMVHLNSASPKVAIYEEGGGACFNDTSCTTLNIDLPSYTLGQGIFNFTNPDNPIRDWNVFYVPYCEGDVHAGDNAAGDPGPLTGTTRYAGYSNVKLYLARILGTVPNPTDVLLTGSSAGGFGAGLTADLVTRNMPPSVQRFTLLDDSGPPMSSKYTPTCLQSQWRTVWGFENTFLKDCGPACSNPNDYVSSWTQFLIDKYAKGPDASKFMAGLISATGDAIISSFFGFGANDCASPAPVPLNATQFEAGLLDIRDSTSSQTDRFGTFFYDSTAHTTLILDAGQQTTGVGLLGGLYDTQVSGVKLTAWIRDLLDHKQAGQVGP